jgi:tRNA(Ile)-lysidine synthase
MASSRKSNLTDAVAARLAPHLPQSSHILIGLSGGMDSVVLLHLLHNLAPRFEWRLSALHIHHGISPNADAWADFCTELCSRYAIPLHIERVSIASLRADHGVEAAARKLRHAAFAQQSCDFIALAHHADDQAETLLLQLLRGAGIRGAAAMPLLKPAISPAPATVRPLLDLSRVQLFGYAQQCDLSWIEDESNADQHYPRNFLRHRLLPVLAERFPAYRNTLIRSAQHFAEAGELLDELARQDAVDSLHDDTLEVNALQSLSIARGKNLLRYFLHARGSPMPQTVQLEDMLRQLCTAREDAAVCIAYGEWQVRRYQGRAYAMRALDRFDPAQVTPWNGEAELEWPALRTRITWMRTQGLGISCAKLQLAPVTLRFRNGGEALRPYPDAATKSLKHLLQEHRVPPWQRERLPLLYCGGELVCVVGVAVSAKYQARQNEEGVLVSCKQLEYDSADRKM